MRATEGGNLVLRFVLEMATLVALAYWGFSLDAGVPVSVVAGLGAPAVAALSWGRFIAPKAATRLEDPARLAAELCFFGAGAVALMLSGPGAVAVAYVVAVVVHVTLMVTLKQR